MQPDISIIIHSNFDLKKLAIDDLVRSSRAPEHIIMTIEELEYMRTNILRVPASKYGLEVICGASCETGAQ